jgi:hypothetical protein
MLADRDAKEELQWLEFEKFPIWEACGAEKEVLTETTARSGGPLFEPDTRNGWANGFAREGDRLMEKARSPARSDPEKAYLYDQAVLYYGIAKMPSVETPAKRQAYQRAGVAGQLHQYLSSRRIPQHRLAVGAGRRQQGRVVVEADRLDETRMAE